MSIAYTIPPTMYGIPWYSISICNLNRFTKYRSIRVVFFEDKTFKLYK